MEILGMVWISGSDPIGVACIENEAGKRSVRIKPVTGKYEGLDTQSVAENGAKLEYEVARAFFPALITKENFKA